MNTFVVGVCVCVCVSFIFFIDSVLSTGQAN